MISGTFRSACVAHEDSRERECTECGTRWSYYETGSIGCPACGSLHSVGLDERTEHTDLRVEFDLTPVRADIDEGRPTNSPSGLETAVASTSAVADSSTPAISVTSTTPISRRPNCSTSPISSSANAISRNAKRCTSRCCATPTTTSARRPTGFRGRCGRAADSPTPTRSGVPPGDPNLGRRPRAYGGRTNRPRDARRTRQTRSDARRRRQSTDGRTAGSGHASSRTESAATNWPS